MDKVNNIFKHGTGKTNTHIGHLIDVATEAGNNKSENWTMFMEICDAINAAEDGPKDATRAIRKKFQSKNSFTVTFTLALLETCVKNCGKRFHLQIATKDFLQDMLKVIGPKNNPSLDVQLKVLTLLQTWAIAFQSYPDLKEINKTYQDLKGKGVEFPPVDQEKSSPANIPPWSAPTVVPTEISSVNTSRSDHVAAGSPPTRPAAAAGGGAEMTAERAAKLHTDLAAAQQNCTVFNELLTEASAGGSSAADLNLIEDLNKTCREMQQRIQHLLSRVQNEQIMGDLLTVNDEFNNVFLRYDRFKRIQSGRASSIDSNQAAPVQTSAAPVGNLLDFEDQSHQLPGELQGMNISGRTRDESDGSRAIYDNQPSGNEADFLEMQKWLLENPGTTSAGGSGAPGGSDDFDKFLSQRQKEAEKLPNVSQSASSNTRGVSSATNNNEPLFSL